MATNGPVENIFFSGDVGTIEHIELQLEKMGSQLEKMKKNMHSKDDTSFSDLEDLIVTFKNIKEKFYETRMDIKQWLIEYCSSHKNITEKNPQILNNEIRSLNACVWDTYPKII